MVFAAITELARRACESRPPKEPPRSSPAAMEPVDMPAAVRCQDRMFRGYLRVCDKSSVDVDVTLCPWGISAQGHAAGSRASGC